MTKRKRIMAVTASSVAMALLIFDAEKAYTGASAGLDLCMKAIIPTLFPFFVITGYLNNVLLGMRIPGAGILTRIFHIPKGCESLLMVGLMGGYPVGAQLIADTCNNKILKKDTGRILLGYCSNAGPAFIFGVAGSLFSSKSTVFLVWLIHILSAVFTGCLLPKTNQTQPVCIHTSPSSLVQVLRKSINICASVCGWVILFKVGLAFLEPRLLKIMTPLSALLITGLLELSNGCLRLQTVPSEAVRFVICSIYLASGGLCVLFQTFSVTEKIGTGLYIPGKLLQSFLSAIMAVLILPIWFPHADIETPTRTLILIVGFLSIILLRKYCKKRCGISENNHV